VEAPRCYTLGVRRLWRARGAAAASGRRTWHVSHSAGWPWPSRSFSPIDPLAGRSFTLHMVQHELLMIVAAPLLVLGRPLEAFAWSLAPPARSALAAFARIGWLRRSWAAITEPVGAWCFHAAALWAWHVPALFALALADSRVHVLQHSCFLGSALAFWWAAFGGARRRADGLSLAMVFTTLAAHRGVGRPPRARQRTLVRNRRGVALFGLSAVEDQQLGGLVMWVPAACPTSVRAVDGHGMDFPAGDARRRPA
jgi:putative membrane protein